MAGRRGVSPGREEKPSFGWSSQQQAEASPHRAVGTPYKPPSHPLAALNEHSRKNRTVCPLHKKTELTSRCELFTLGSVFTNIKKLPLWETLFLFFFPPRPCSRRFCSSPSPKSKLGLAISGPRVQAAQRERERKRRAKEGAPEHRKLFLLVHAGHTHNTDGMGRVSCATAASITCLCPYQHVFSPGGRRGKVRTSPGYTRTPRR